MRQRNAGTELERLLIPLQRLGDQGYRLLPVWMGMLFVAWLGSGITVVRADEVALVLRFGALVDAGTPQAVRQPGLLLAPPSPVGEVVRVPVRRVFEVELGLLHFARPDESRPASSDSFDPREVGYALTGDRNVVHAAMTARFQILDPIAYTFGVDDPEQLLGAIVVDEMGRAIGSRGVDAVLTEARADLGESVLAASQARLDDVGAGLVLVSVELADLRPPVQVDDDFADVQSASIHAQTLIQQAREYEAQVVPAASGFRSATISEAEAEASGIVAEARGEADAFLAVAAEYQRSPDVVRARLYREGIEGPLRKAGAVRFVPPPIGSRYGGFRVSVQ